MDAAVDAPGGGSVDAPGGGSVDAPARTVWATLAFVSNRTGSATVFVANEDGSQPKALAPGQNPEWSPDGTLLAFDRGGEIYVRDSNGHETRVTTGAAPSWSADSRRLVYVINNRQLGTINIDGTQPTVILTEAAFPWSNDERFADPAWSPDGRTIAVLVTPNDDVIPDQTWLVDPDGSNLEKLTSAFPAQYAEFAPDWSPDSARITQTMYDHGLVIDDLSSNTSPSVRVDDDNGVVLPYGGASWSRDGARLVFPAYETIGGLPRSRIFTIPVTGGTWQRLIANESAQTAYADSDPQLPR